jgi:pyruvate,water dikinase
MPMPRRAKNPAPSARRRAQASRASHARQTLGAAVFALGWTFTLACSGGGDSAPGGDAGAGGEAGAAGAAGAHPGVEYLAQLRSAEEYGSLAAEGAEVKYLATVDGREPEPAFAGAECLFQNTAKYPYHVQFLRTFDGYEGLSAERYPDLVLRRASRSMWGGGLRLFPATPHPVTGTVGVLAYTIYSESSVDEMLTVGDIVEVQRRLETAASFAAELLVFTPDGAAQIAALGDEADELLAEGVAMVDSTLLRPGFLAETYVDGEGYGYLRLLAEGADADDVGPRDVLVIDAAPNDLGLVAGLVTRVPQSLGSHVNLRLREKGIPSAAVAGVLENKVLAALADSLVHITAQGARVQIEPASLEDAEAFWNAHRPQLGDPASDLGVTELRPLELLTAADARAYGAKAANLGELATVLRAENRVSGFALPFSAYATFMTETGLDSEVESLLADDTVYTDAAHKRARLETLRDRIRATEMPPALARRLATAISDAYGEAGTTTRLRFRSSTNAEDLPGVSGAGLYDSRSGCLGDDLDEDDTGPSACLSVEHETHLRAELERRQAELAADPERTFLIELVSDLDSDLKDEKSAWRAVRRVWASLWNARAFDDREYYGIDHRTVFMGIAVHPTFVGEELEAVVVTGLEPDAGAPLYRVVSQRGEIGLVRPLDPEARPEILSFRRGEADLPEDINLLQTSSLVDAGQSLWRDDRLRELAGMLFDVHDHFSAAVYPELEPLLLDLEVDVTMDGRTVIKQVRPYVF